MSSFDYGAPAELFLFKPAKGFTPARNIGGPISRQPLRTCARPKPSALGLEVGDERSPAAKFNACTKPRTILCGSLSDAKRMATSLLNDLRCARLTQCPRIDRTTLKSNLGHSPV